MRRILVIDDDENIREMLKQYLERKEYEVLEASDGKEGLELHRATPVDLVITDIIMPEKEGLETIMEFQRDFPSVRIVAVSGGGKISANEYLKIANALGAQRTLSKPFELNELLEAVTGLLGTIREGPPSLGE